MWDNRVRLQVGPAASGCGTAGCVWKWVRHNWVHLQGVQHHRVRMQVGAAELGEPASGCGTTGCACKWVQHNLVQHNWMHLQADVVQLGAPVQGEPNLETCEN